MFICIKRLTSPQRRWKISAQTDLTLKPNFPLKILKKFVPTHDWTLGAGDMLYLPPQFAHDGVAVDTCTTYSIGFRSPQQMEIVTAVVDELLETLSKKTVATTYRDPALRATETPGEIPAVYLQNVRAMLSDLKLTDEIIARAVGKNASEPKPHVRFHSPENPISEAEFNRYTKTMPIALSPASVMLFDANAVYWNGDIFPISASLQALANDRVANISRISAAERSRLYDAYDAGWIEIKS